MSTLKEKFKFPLSVLLLVVMDQGIKIYINNNMFDKTIYIFKDLVAFKPIMNTAYSWINSLGKFGIGLWPHLIFNFTVLVLTISIFAFYKEKYKPNKAINLFFLVWFAGLICSTIDKMFWGGTLDYIYLKNLFTFDLKDAYITLSEIILVFYAAVNYKVLNKMDDKLLYKEFRLFIKGKLRRS